jgi:hypothetical protein
VIRDVNSGARRNTAALAYVTAFVDDVKKNGFVAAAVPQTGLPSSAVAP